MSVKVPAKSFMKVTNNPGDDEDEVTPKNAQAPNLKTAFVQDSLFNSPRTSDVTASLVQKKQTATKKVPSGSNGKSPKGNASLSNYTHKIGVPNNGQVKKVMDHNIRITNQAHEIETMLYKSGDESMYKHQINQLGGIMLDDLSNNDVATVLGRTNNAIKPSNGSGNMDDPYTYDVETSNEVKSSNNFQPPKSTNTTQTRQFQANSQNRFKNDFFGQRKASQNSKGGLPVQNSHKSSDSRSDIGKGRKVKFQPRNNFVESNYDTNNQYGVNQDAASRLNRYEQGSVKTQITMVNNYESAPRVTNKKKRGVHRSIDFENSGSLLSSNQSNITKQNRNTLALEPLHPFEKPAPPKLMKQFSEQSELTLKNQRVVGDTPFTGPTIHIGTMEIQNRQQLSQKKPKVKEVVIEAPKSVPIVETQVKPVVKNARGINAWAAVKQKLITKPKEEKAAEKPVEPVKLKVQTPKKVEPEAPVVVKQEVITIKIESLEVETPKMDTAKLTEPSKDEMVKTISKDELPKLDLKNMNHKMVETLATKKTDKTEIKGIIKQTPLCVQSNVIVQNNEEDLFKPQEKIVSPKAAPNSKEQVYTANMSKISYLLDDDNAITDSQMPDDQSDHPTEQIAILDDENPYKEETMSYAKMPKSRMPSALGSLYHADRSHDSVSHATERMHQLHSPTMSATYDERKNTGVFETEEERTMEDIQPAQPEQVQEDTTEAFNWMMNGLQVQLRKILMNANNDGQNTQTFGLNSGINSTPKIATVDEIKEGEVYNENITIDVQTHGSLHSSQATQPAPQVRNEMITSQYGSKLGTDQATTEFSGDRQTNHQPVESPENTSAKLSFSDLLNDLNENVKENIDLIWNKTDQDKNGLLDKGKFKDFLSNVTNLIFLNKEHNFNETDFEDLFDKYTQSQRLGVGKSEIADLIEQIFKETKIDDKSTARIEIVEKAVELSKRSKQSIGLDPPSFGESEKRQVSPKTLVELACQTEPEIDPPKVTIRDELKENSILTVSDVPVFQLYANLDDYKPPQQVNTDQHTLAPLGISVSNQQSQQLSNKEFIEAKFDDPAQEIVDLGQDIPEHEVLASSMPSVKKSKGKKSIGRKSPQRDGSHHLRNQNMASSIGSTSANAKYLLQTKIYNQNGSNGKGPKHSQGRAYTAANMSPSSRKKQLSNKNKLIIGGASLHQGKKGKRGPVSFETYNDYFTYSSNNATYGKNEPLGRKPLDSQDSIFMRNYKQAKERNQDMRHSMDNSLSSGNQIQGNDGSQNAMFQPQTVGYMHTQKSQSPPQVFRKEFQSHVQQKSSNDFEKSRGVGEAPKTLNVSSQGSQPGEPNEFTGQYTISKQISPTQGAPYDTINKGVNANSKDDKFDTKHPSGEMELFRPSLMEEDGSMEYPVNKDNKDTVEILEDNIANIKAKRSNQTISSISQQEVNQDAKMGSKSGSDSILSRKEAPPASDSRKMFVDRSQQHSKPLSKKPSHKSSAKEFEKPWPDTQAQAGSDPASKKGSGSGGASMTQIDKSCQQPGFRLPAINQNRLETVLQMEAQQQNDKKYVDQSQQMSIGKLWSQDSRKFEDNIKRAAQWQEAQVEDAVDEMKAFTQVSQPLKSQNTYYGQQSEQISTQLKQLWPAHQDAPDGSMHMTRVDDKEPYLQQLNLEQVAAINQANKDELQSVHPSSSAKKAPAEAVRLQQKRQTKTSQQQRLHFDRSKDLTVDEYSSDGEKPVQASAAKKYQQVQVARQKDQSIQMSQPGPPSKKDQSVQLTQNAPAKARYTDQSVQLTQLNEDGSQIGVTQHPGPAYKDASIQMSVHSKPKSKKKLAEYTDQAVQLSQNHQAHYKDQSVAMSQAVQEGRQDQAHYTDQSVQMSLNHQAPFKDQSVQHYEQASSHKDVSIQMSQKHVPAYRDQGVQLSEGGPTAVLPQQNPKATRHATATNTIEEVQESKYVEPTASGRHQLSSNALPSAREEPAAADRSPAYCDRSQQYTAYNQPVETVKAPAVLDDKHVDRSQQFSRVDCAAQYSAIGGKPAPASVASGHGVDRSQQYSRAERPRTYSEAGPALAYQPSGARKLVDQSQQCSRADQAAQYSQPGAPAKVSSKSIGSNQVGYLADRSAQPSLVHQKTIPRTIASEHGGVDQSVQYSHAQLDASPRSKGMAVQSQHTPMTMTPAELTLAAAPARKNELIAEHIYAYAASIKSKEAQLEEEAIRSLQACNQVYNEEIRDIILRQQNGVCAIGITQEEQRPTLPELVERPALFQGAVAEPEAPAGLVTADQGVETDNLGPSLNQVAENSSRTHFVMADQIVHENTRRGQHLVTKLSREAAPEMVDAEVQMSQKSVSVKAAAADGTAVQTDQEASKEEAKVDTLKDTSIQTVLYLEAQQLKDENKQTPTRGTFAKQASKSSVNATPQLNEPSNQGSEAPTSLSASRPEIDAAAALRKEEAKKRTPQGSNPSAQREPSQSQLDLNLQSSNQPPSSQDIGEIHQDLGSLKTTEIQSLSRQLIQQYQEAEDQDTFEQEERELLLERQQIIIEKDKVIQQLKQLEAEKKENEQNKRKAVLEVEKENLRQDLNELDQLKELLSVMSKAKNASSRERLKTAEQTLNKDLRKETPSDYSAEQAQQAQAQKRPAQHSDQAKTFSTSQGMNNTRGFRGYAADRDDTPEYGTFGQKPQTAEVGGNHKQYNNIIPELKVHNVDPSSSAQSDAEDLRKPQLPNQNTPANEYIDNGMDGENADQAATESNYYYNQEESEEEREELEAHIVFPNKPGDSIGLELTLPGGHQIAAVKLPKQKNQDQANIDLLKREALLQEAKDSYFGKQLTVSQANSLSNTQQSISANQTFLSASGLYDWYQSSILQDVLDKREKFVSRDEGHYDEDEILHLIEQVKKSHMQSAEFQKGNLQVVFKKSFQTVAELMNVLNQKQLFEMIAKKYNKVNLENTAKLLVRCKSLLSARQLVYKTLKSLLIFEKSVKTIRQNVNKYLDSSQPTAEDLDKLKSQITKLPTISNAIIDNIVVLRDHYRLFNTMVAITSKGNQVANLMAYRRRDAMRYVIKEYDGIKRLVQVVDDVEALPVLAPK